MALQIGFGIQGNEVSGTPAWENKIIVFNQFLRVD